MRIGDVGLESVVRERFHVRPGISFAHCIWGAVSLCPRQTSRVQRVDEPAEQEEMARTQGLHDARLTNGAPVESTDAS